MTDEAQLREQLRQMADELERARAAAKAAELRLGEVRAEVVDLRLQLGRARQEHDQLLRSAPRRGRLLRVHRT